MHVGLATGMAHQRGNAYPDVQFVQEEIENLVLAEELGFDSVWITEHHFSDYSMSNDPLQLLTYIAGRTKPHQSSARRSSSSPGTIRCVSPSPSLISISSRAVGRSWASATASPA